MSSTQQLLLGEGAGSSGPPVYIEDVFSTFLYTGNGSTQTITNGIDLSTKGGLVWGKSRSNAYDNFLADSVRGSSKLLYSNQTYAQQTDANVFSAFNSNGFSLGPGGAVSSNTNNATYASWTFREQPKFFDVVTYTGTGTTAQNINHNLGSVPGCIIIKRTDSSGDWGVVHRSTNAYANYGFVGGKLNTTGVVGQTVAEDTGIYYNNSTYFQVDEGSAYFNPNASGGTYVAYLFAHDAGGFGLAGTDNVISCGSFTTNGSGDATINLGYEPQWLLQKSSDASGNWFIADVMRGMTVSSAAELLRPNLSTAESAGGTIKPTATGFTANSFLPSTTYIYIAIRRGPMAVPTLGTSVYENTAYTGNGASERKIGSSVLTDLLLLSNTNANADGWTLYAQYIYDRLRGQNLSLQTSLATAETSGWTTYFNLDMNTGWDTGNTTDQGYLNKSISTYVSNIFRRAPSFLDVVCYTGTGSATTFSHNLGVVPELMIAKCRNDSGQWAVYSSSLLASEYLFLNSTAAKATNSAIWNATAPTSSVFSVGTSLNTNSSGFTFVAYLFATCAGVSKVGSYTGTGTTLQINCGFTAGSRFVMIKRTDSTGDWYVWNSASGIVAGNDPYILLNSAAAEVTGTDYIDTASSGFEISSTAPAAINANGGTFIFLAIA